jgi:hypothetical protein
MFLRESRSTSNCFFPEPAIRDNLPASEVPSLSRIRFVQYDGTNERPVTSCRTSFLGLHCRKDVVNWPVEPGDSFTASIGYFSGTRPQGPGPFKRTGSSRPGI